MLPFAVEHGAVDVVVLPQILERKRGQRLIGVVMIVADHEDYMFAIVAGESERRFVDEDPLLRTVGHQYFSMCSTTRSVPR